MKRDWRLPVSIVALIVSAASGVKHSVLTSQWAFAWASGDEEAMQRLGANPPTNCKYDCYGWGAYPGDVYQYVAVAGFVSALALILWAWLRPAR